MGHIANGVSDSCLSEMSAISDPPCGQIFFWNVVRTLFQSIFASRSGDFILFETFLADVVERKYFVTNTSRNLALDSCGNVLVCVLSVEFVSLSLFRLHVCVCVYFPPSKTLR